MIKKQSLESYLMKDDTWSFFNAKCVLSSSHKFFENCLTELSLKHLLEKCL